MIIKEISKKQGISNSDTLCQENEIEGVMNFGKSLVIPSEAKNQKARELEVVSL